MYPGTSLKPSREKRRWPDEAEAGVPMGAPPRGLALSFEQAK